MPGAETIDGDPTTAKASFKESAGRGQKGRNDLSYPILSRNRGLGASIATAGRVLASVTPPRPFSGHRASG